MDLSVRKPRDEEETYFEDTLCPCEAYEVPVASTYETPKPWVTYTGEEDQEVYDTAAASVLGDLMAEAYEEAKEDKK